MKKKNTRNKNKNEKKNHPKDSAVSIGKVSSSHKRKYEIQFSEMIKTSSTNPIKTDSSTNMEEEIPTTVSPKHTRVLH